MALELEVKGDVCTQLQGNAIEEIKDYQTKWKQYVAYQEHPCIDLHCKLYSAVYTCWYLNQIWDAHEMGGIIDKF